MITYKVLAQSSTTAQRITKTINVISMRLFVASLFVSNFITAGIVFWLWGGSH